MTHSEDPLDGPDLSDVAHQRAAVQDTFEKWQLHNKQTAGCKSPEVEPIGPSSAEPRTRTQTTPHRGCANSRRLHAAPPGGVCVDVVDLLALHARVLQRQVDAGGHAQAISTRVGHVVRIAGDSATQVLCIAQHKEDTFNSMHMAHGGVSRHAISRVIASGLSSCVTLQKQCLAGLSFGVQLDAV